jgi:potassium/chloride transporter 4/5/6
LCPQFALFGDFETNKDILYHNIRIYGTLFLIIIGFMVFIGVRFVSKFAPIALLCVLVSIASIYLGIFVNYAGLQDYKICTIGGRVLSDKNSLNCSQEGLRRIFCNDTFHCDPFFEAHLHDIRHELAIPGLASGVFWDNLMPKFREKDALVATEVSPSMSAQKDYLSALNYIFVDITSSFTVLVAIYFPSCTGILAGSNRSGDLADAQKAIPLGTISAQLTTSVVYLSVILLFGASYNPLFIRDKFGESLGKELAVSPPRFHSNRSNSCLPTAGDAHLVATPPHHPDWRAVVDVRRRASVTDWCAASSAGHRKGLHNSLLRAHRLRQQTRRTRQSDRRVARHRRVRHL